MKRTAMPVKRQGAIKGHEIRQTMTVDAFARRVGIGRKLAYEAAARNELPVPVIRIGRRMVIPIAAVDQLLSSSGDARPSMPGDGRCES